MKETWLPIPGYIGLYEVSDHGNVRSKGHVCNGIHVPSTMLKQHLSGGRYMRVKLYKDGKPKTMSVHRLVAITFVKNPGNKLQVNHIDGNRLNNRADNLEWCTQAENNKHALRIGLNSTNQAVNARKKEVLQLSTDGETIARWESMTQAARSLCVDVSGISLCCSGKIKTCGGYRWELCSES